MIQVPGLSSLWQPALDGRTESKRLMVLLHGRGDSAEGWADFQRLLGIQDVGVLLLNAPDPYYTGYSWYDLPPDQLPGILRSRELLAGAFDALWARGFEPSSTILAGFSQGCLMTLEFGARYPRRLAGYLGISGYCYDEEALIREATPAAPGADWLITHGTHDEVLPVARTRAQMTALRGAGWKIDYREYLKDHTLDPGQELEDIREWVRGRFASAR